ncbi:hypothetical protein BLOT_010285 [Blomia tropicalis]|nr:hypothetical protein BLOT_010285 [Blomia tropicalis]
MDKEIWKYNILINESCFDQEKKTRKKYGNTFKVPWNNLFLSAENVNDRNKEYAAQQKIRKHRYKEIVQDLTSQFVTLLLRHTLLISLILECICCTVQFMNKTESLPST